MEPNEIKEKMKLVNDKIIKLEKQIAKMEEDDIFDDNLYKQIEELEEERDKLNSLLDTI